MRFEKKMLFGSKSGVMILNTDVFFDKGPGGIYSFEWVEGDGPIVYVEDPSKLRGHSDFKSEQKLAFLFGSTTVPVKEHISI